MGERVTTLRGGASPMGFYRRLPGGYPIFPFNVPGEAE